MFHSFVFAFFCFNTVITKYVPIPFFCFTCLLLLLQIPTKEKKIRGEIRITPKNKPVLFYFFNIFYIHDLYVTQSRLNSSQCDLSNSRLSFWKSNLLSIWLYHLLVVLTLSYKRYIGWRFVRGKKQWRCACSLDIWRPWSRSLGLVRDVWVCVW